MIREEKKMEAASYEDSDGKLEKQKADGATRYGENAQNIYIGKYQDKCRKSSEGEINVNLLRHCDQEHKTENNSLSENQLMDQSWHQYEDIHRLKDGAEIQDESNFLYLKGSETTPHLPHARYPTSAKNSDIKETPKILFHFDDNKQNFEINRKTDILYSSDDEDESNYSDDRTVEQDEARVAERFSGLTGTQLERLSLDSFRDWKSTGNINCQSNKAKFSPNTSLEVSAMLDASVGINTERMEWREKLLEKKADRRKLLKALYMLDATNEYAHPLHELKAENCGPLDVPGSDSSNGGSRHGKMSSLRRHRSIGRRFLDLTVKGGEDEFGDTSSDEDDETFDGLSCTGSTASSFSIPIFRRRERSSGMNSSRRFIDLTEGKDEPTSENKQKNEGQKIENRRNLLSKMTSWLSISAENGLTATDESTPEMVPTLSESEELDIKNDEDEDEDSAVDYNCKYAYAWENADAVFIEEVHEISNRLETMLNEKGLESPYWNADEVIPTFKGLHSQMKENMDRRSRGVKGTLKNVRGIPTSVSFSSFRERTRDDSFSRNPLPLDELIGSYDDLGFRTIQRCDLAYLKKFFYEKTGNFFSLPAVLATGLDKRLPIETIETAADIIDELTSPLRRRRRLSDKQLHTINESGI